MRNKTYNTAPLGRLGENFEIEMACATGCVVGRLRQMGVLECSAWQFGCQPKAHLRFHYMCLIPSHGRSVQVLAKQLHQMFFLESGSKQSANRIFDSLVSSGVRVRAEYLSVKIMQLPTVNPFQVVGNLGIGQQTGAVSGVLM